MTARVELHQTRAGESGEEAAMVLVRDGGIGPDYGGSHTRGADIDDEDAAAGPVMPKAQVRKATRGRTCRD